MAPLLFASVLQKLVNEIKTTALQLLLNLWNLDDGHIAGDARDVLRWILYKKRAPSWDFILTYPNV